jgi:hypothetical protein
MAGKGGPKGNNYGTKLKHPDVRQEAYRQYCDYLAQGNSKEGWKFQHPEFSCTFKTMEKYIRENPLEFPIIKKDLAEADSFRVWEQRGISMLKGEMKAETALYQMFMRNKFGWDKDDIDEVAECAADKILESIRKGSS